MRQKFWILSEKMYRLFSGNYSADGVACNCEGTELLPLVRIGMSK